MYFQLSTPTAYGHITPDSPCLAFSPEAWQNETCCCNTMGLFFFIEPWTNTFTQTHTPNHTQKQNTQRQTSSDRGTWKDIQWCHCWNIQEWFKEMTKCWQITTQREHKDAFTQRQKSDKTVKRMTCDSMKKYALTSALTHADTIVLSFKLELSGVRSCFIHCGYCTSQPTCSLLCDIILPLILLHYQLFSLRSSYTVSCAASHMFASSIKQVLPPGVPRVSSTIWPFLFTCH